MSDVSCRSATVATAGSARQPRGAGSNTRRLATQQGHGNDEESEEIEESFALKQSRATTKAGPVSRTPSTAQGTVNSAGRALKRTRAFFSRTHH